MRLEKLEQRLFSTKEQRHFLEQWRKAEKYQLSSAEFCQALIANGTAVQKKLGQKGLDAPRQGQRLVDALDGWFPSHVLLSLRAAEKAGQRSVGIETALSQLEGGENVVLTITKLLAFPFTLCLGAGIYGVFIADKILQATPMEVGWGSAMRDGVATYGPWLALMALLALVMLSLALPRWHGALRVRFDGLPIFSLYRSAVAASTLKTLANLTRCGVKLQDALAQAKEGNTRYANTHLIQMQKQSVGQGNLGYILDTGLLRADEVGIIKVLGDRARYSELLQESGEHHQAHVTKQLAKMKVWLPKVGLAINIALLGGLILTAVAQLYFSL